MGTLQCKGVESLETERKEPGGHSPRPAAPWGTRGVIGCRCECTVALLRGLLPLLAPAVSSVCSPQVLPHIHFLLCFSTFIFHFSVPIPCLSFPCFLSHSQCGRKAAQESPLPPALEEKPGPRRQTLPLVCWKQVGWFFHHKSRTPKAVGHTSGSAEGLLGAIVHFNPFSVDYSRSFSWPSLDLKYLLYWCLKAHN